MAPAWPSALAALRPHAERPAKPPAMASAGQRAEASAAQEPSSSEASAGQHAEATAAPQPSPPSSPQHTNEIDRDVQLLLAGGLLRAVPHVHEFAQRVYLDLSRGMHREFIRAISTPVEIPAGLPPVPGLIFETRQSILRAELAETHIEGVLEHTLAAEICECRLAGRDEEPARLASMLWEWAVRYTTRI